MGQQNVSGESSEQDLRAFVRALLDDVEALERMLEGDLIESGIRRVGAEQEMFLVDKALRPAPVADEVLAALDDPSFTTELARFNLEANCVPRVFGGDCLRRLEAELVCLLDKAREAAATAGADVLVTGILPTLRKADLTLDNMTPRPRYFALNKALTQLRSGTFRVVLKGLDEIDLEHDNVMLEACNTSFQVHFQVGAQEFAKLYNVAQAVTAPVLAAAVNSPTLLGQRLWRETRVGLFQQSVDARSSVHQARGQRPRVSFGDSWVKESVIEIFREDISRFRVVLAGEHDEDPLALVKQGIAPQLAALRLHNGTVYRWNRACYGVNDGVAHLRVENRVLPAGPTLVDEVANAAFYYGLMSAVTEEYGDVTRRMEFDDAKSNFFSAARYGLKAQLVWMDGRARSAGELITGELLPLAREGLLRSGIDADDVDRYLGVLEERVKSQRTGAQWALSSLSHMGRQGTRETRMRALAKAMLDHQREGEPVHTWPLAELDDGDGWRHGYETVGQFMTTEVFTVRREDVIDLAARMMEWERVRHIPVEDDEGRLVGILSHRDLLGLVGRALEDPAQGPVTVDDIMCKTPITVTPDTPTLEAIRKMRDHQIGCLPVVEGDRLVGIVSERTFLDVAASLVERELGQR